MVKSHHAALLCALLILAACTAPASRAPEAVGDVASAAEGTAQTEEDPLICESIVRTGTRVAERRCMRQSELDKQRAGGQQALGDWQRRSTHTGNRAVE